MNNARGAFARKLRADSPRKILTNQECARQLRDVMKRTYGESKWAAKDAADDAASSVRAAENWMAGENPMGLTAFLNAYHSNPKFKAWARRILLLEADLDPSYQPELAAFIRAIQVAAQ